MSTLPTLCNYGKTRPSKTFYVQWKEIKDKLTDHIIAYMNYVGIHPKVEIHVH